MVDLDDTTKCPERDNCESCGSEDDLAPVTLNSPVGVFCAVVCDPCIEQTLFPRLSWVQAAERVYQHCEHLDLTIDQAAELHTPSTGDGALSL
jgi:hypothetical protein